MLRERPTDYGVARKSLPTRDITQVVEYFHVWVYLTLIGRKLQDSDQTHRTGEEAREHRRADETI